MTMFTKVFSVFLVTMMTVGGFIQPVQAHDVFEVDCDEDGVYFSVNYDWLVDDDVTNMGAHFHVIQDAINAATAGDRIMVCPGFYPENVNIDRSLEIWGASKTASDQVIDGGGVDNVMFVQPDQDLKVVYLQLQNGSDYTGGGIYHGGDLLSVSNTNIINNHAGYDGGAIYGATVSGPMTIDNSTFENNNAFMLGGAVRDASASSSLNVYNSLFKNNSTDGNGGAISTKSDLFVLDSTFENNIAYGLLSGGSSDGGGAISGLAVTVDGSTFEDNTAEATNQADGGAINVSQDIYVTDSTFLGNAASDGGAIFARDSVYVTSSDFEDNTVTDVASGQASGGAIFAYNPSPASGAVMEITDSTFTSNQADYEGGALYPYNVDTVAIEGSVFTDNSAKNGGALSSHMSLGTTIDIIGSEFTGNTASLSGGAIEGHQVAHTISDTQFVSNSATWSGGSIDVIGDLVVTHSYFGQNGGAKYGGAIRFSGISSAPHLVNNTFYGNSSSLYGGALYDNNNYSQGAVLNNNTFYENSSNLGGAMAHGNTTSPPTYHLKNNLLANNTSGSVDDACDGTATFTSHGYNATTVSSSADCGLSHGTDLLSTTPGFATTTPQNNGGDTDTLALSASSALVDAGSCTDIAGATITEDQRHYARPSGVTCDIGAYEY